MWSSIYKYYQIRKDKQYSEFIDTETISSIILSDENIIQNGNLTFESKKKSPWISITIIKTDDGNYHINKDTYFKKINLIEVITSNGNEKWYLDLMKKISEKFGWEIMLEED